MDSVVAAYSSASDSDGLSFEGSFDGSIQDEYSEFGTSDGEDDDEDVVVDVPFVASFKEGELQTADWPVLDPLQLAFVTSCKISSEQENPNYSVVKLVVMQNTLADIYVFWAANAPEDAEDVQIVNDQAVPNVLEVAALDPDLPQIAINPRRTSLNAAVPQQMQSPGPEQEKEVIIPQRTVSSKSVSPVSPPPSPPEKDKVLAGTISDSAFDAYLNLTLDDLADSATEDNSATAQSIAVPARSTSQSQIPSVFPSSTLNISPRQDSISIARDAHLVVSDKPSVTTQEVINQPLTPPQIDSLAPASKIVIQPRTHSRKANALIMNSQHQPVRIVPIIPQPSRPIPPRKKQNVPEPLSLQEEYAFLTKYFQQQSSTPTKPMVINNLLPPRSDEEHEIQLNRTSSAASTIKRGPSVTRRPSGLSIRSSSASISSPTTPTMPLPQFHNFMSQPPPSHPPPPPKKSASPTEETPPKKKKMVRNKPLPTPPTTFPITSVDTSTPSFNETRGHGDTSFSFDLGSREEITTSTMLLSRSDSTLTRSTTQKSRNSSRLSVPGGGEWAESVVNTFLQRTSVLNPGGYDGKSVTEKRSRSLKKKDSGRVRSTGSGDLFALYHEHGGRRSDQSSPVTAVMVSPPPTGYWNIDGTNRGAMVAQIPARTSSRTVNPDMENALMAKYQSIMGTRK
ncbi:hypothetical protein BDR26DRAFT_861913 [Obelidium mucronatum]|nr:hypothetical protein BDR26DRAFT_861913 [Obelidium mucronatum]